MMLMMMTTVLLAMAAHASAATCTPEVAPRSATLRIAMVIHGPPLADPLGPAVKLDSNPIMFSPSFFTNPRDQVLFQAAQLYQENIDSISGLPLSDGTKLPVELVYFNMGPSSIPAANATLYTQRAAALGALLANTTGPYGHFAFILTPAFSSNAKLPIQLAFMEACETSQTCITIGAVSGEPDQYMCPSSNPPDCVARGRLPGSRRFRFGFSNFVDPTNDFKGHVTGLRQQSARTTALLFDSVGNTAATLVQTQRIAIQTGVKVLYKLQIPLGGTLANLDLTAGAVADALVSADPDSLLIATSVGQPSAIDIAAILKECKARNWWPKSINFGGGVDASILGSKLLTADDLLYTSGMNPWSSLFQDTGYHAVNVDGVNYEMYSSTDAQDSPAVFADAMDLRWGYNTDRVGGYVFAAAITGALQMVQKMVELTLTDDAPTIAASASGLSAPSVWGLIQFDSVGRPVMRDAALYQNMAGGAKVMVYPPNIAQDLVYPIPDFDERVFEPKYVTPGGQDATVIAISAAGMVYVALWMAFVVRCWNTRVIRAATPLFCLFMLGGCFLLMMSNLFLTTQSTDARCATMWWLLSLGFTLTFAPLFIKTYRIYGIFNMQRLQVKKLPTKELVMFLGAVLAVDILVNALWTGMGGTDVKLLVPDPFRPSNNVQLCHSSNVTPYLATHAAIKGLMTLVGMVLSWKTRKVDKLFNESFHSMLAIYNLAMVCAFTIPMVAGEVGGATTALLIQALAVVFIATATTTIMFVPKYMSVAAPNGDDSGSAENNKTALGSEDTSADEKDASPSPTNKRSKPPSVRAVAGTIGTNKPSADRASADRPSVTPQATRAVRPPALLTRIYAPSASGGTGSPHTPARTGSPRTPVRSSPFVAEASPSPPPQVDEPLSADMPGHVEQPSAAPNTPTGSRNN